jgi:hypothetical protein
MLYAGTAVLPFAAFQKPIVQNQIVQNQPGDKHMMSFTRHITGKIAIGLLGVLAFGLCMSEDLPYKEGTVSEVTSIKVKEGHFLDYWAFLSTAYRQQMDEAKKQGLIVSYQIFSANPKTPNEPDLYLVTEYANMAALDGLDAKMSAISAKLAGSMKQADQKDAERDAIRTVMGSEWIRELKFNK